MPPTRDKWCTYFEKCRVKQASEKQCAFAELCIEAWGSGVALSTLLKAINMGVVPVLDHTNSDMRRVIEMVNQEDVYVEDGRDPLE